MSTEKIIQFPGARKAEPAKPVSFETDFAKLQPEQQKAVALVLSGKPFLLIAITPADTGADFHTCLFGEPADLRNAQPHFGDLIDRLYARKGI